MSIPAAPGRWLSSPEMDDYLDPALQADASSSNGPSQYEEFQCAAEDPDAAQEQEGYNCYGHAGHMSGPSAENVSHVGYLATNGNEESNGNYYGGAVSNQSPSEWLSMVSRLLTNYLRFRRSIQPSVILTPLKLIPARTEQRITTWRHNIPLIPHTTVVTMNHTWTHNLPAPRRHRMATFL